MTRTAFRFLFPLFCALNASAQTTDSLSKPKIRFCSKNELGGLIGIGQMKDASDYPVHNSEWALELISTNGIRYASWFMGIGAGLRTWSFTDVTFPVFAHVSLDLWKTGLYLHADLGNQFGTRKSNYRGDKETGSFYAAYGLGYTIPTRKQNLYVKASLCHQKMKATGDFSGLGPSNYPEHYSLNYMFARISLGLKFTK